MDGQVHPERGAAAGLALGPDIATVLFGYAVDRCQAKASALPYLLGREERLKDKLQGLLIHAPAGIAYGNHGV